MSVGATGYRGNPGIMHEWQAMVEGAAGRDKPDYRALIRRASYDAW
jgi:hypothetical protein